MIPTIPILVAISDRLFFLKRIAPHKRRHAAGISTENVTYPVSVIMNFSRYRALNIKRKYEARSASCSEIGVHRSPGRSDKVAEAAAAPPESFITVAIFASVCSIECL